ncbi:InlB B-repeat-containing protein [Robinsoniella sp. KNHs210]|uniref:InlB B-repeat-containing protein n=1 Tax=Robinsoniella sp. KNHs210 TaxID=1469950 RepID=UPI0009DF10AC|nr:InlB B-repeat-containing protein [Robinsoniella sp. KNHs210]
MESLPSTAREGYEFQGWFTAQTGGRKVTEATVVTSDMTLYAQWKKMMQPQPKPEVSFTETEYSLYTTQTIKTSVNANAAAGAVTGYKSSNTKVAVVTSAGVIKRIRKGSATITVSTSGKGTATVNVTVKTPKVSLTAKKAKLQAGKSTKAITVKEKQKIEVVRKPVTAADKIDYRSSDSKIAKVDKKAL